MGCHGNHAFKHSQTVFLNSNVIGLNYMLLLYIFYVKCRALLAAEKNRVNVI